jgi:hypothetical protein
LPASGYEASFFSVGRQIDPSDDQVAIRGGSIAGGSASGRLQATIGGDQLVSIAGSCGGNQGIVGRYEVIAPGSVMVGSGLRVSRLARFIAGGLVG